MKALLITLLITLTSTAAQGEIISVEYKRFYSHVNKLNGEDTSALQFAFGFLRVGTQKLCEINSAKIVTQKQTIELDVSLENRFVVPTERVLKLAEAEVVVDLGERANLCDMSVQIETTPNYLKTAYSAEDLDFLKQQYDAFFNEMGGFLSFMMPSVNGLVFRFHDATLDAALHNGLSITNGMLMIDSTWLEQGKTLSLPVAPMRITAKAKS